MVNSGIVKVGTGKAQIQPVLFSAQPTIHYLYPYTLIQPVSRLRLYPTSLLSMAMLLKLNELNVFKGEADVYHIIILLSSIHFFFSYIASYSV